MLTRIYGTAWATEADLDGVPARGWRRRRSATTASSGGSSTCSPRPTSSGRGCGSGTRAAASSASSSRTTCATSTSSAATTWSSRRTSRGRCCGRPPGTWRSTRTTCIRRCRRTTGDYYVKPMNCPFHVLVYKSQVRSYRDLPMRLSELGTIYRHERLGALHGLLRIRGGTQDDSHIICTPDQLIDEILQVFDLTFEIHRDVRVRRSRRQPVDASPGRRSCDETMWRARHRGARDGARQERAAVHRWPRARAPSTDRRSTSTSRTRSGGCGSSPPCSATSRCPSASTWSTRARTTSAIVR